jgi:aspartyl-tRNA(Asn)/glutamyl-tRNA(Gln) amidotransferase subunit C
VLLSAATRKLKDERMSVDSATVARIANLARLSVKDERLEAMAGELNNILAWIEQLSAVDTQDVPPMTSVADATLPLRADVVTDGGNPDDILANGPETEHGFFVVPKVVE